MNKKPTSWGRVAHWYDEYLQDEDTYQAQVIWPNLKRLLDNTMGYYKNKRKDTKPLRLLDIACGQGYFSFLAAGMGYKVTGVDISHELIEVAVQKSKALQTQTKAPKDALPSFEVMSASKLARLNDSDFSCAISVLAMQNIKELDQAFAEAKRVLIKDGTFIFIINHPAFRIPQYSDWVFDTTKMQQSRAVAKYMQEATIEIDMNPGQRTGKRQITYSFHRPMQLFAKLLSKHGFAITRIEEWCSHKKTEAGPRKAAEDLARKEIPLFMCIEAKIFNS